MAGMKKIRPIDANALAESIKRYMKDYRNAPTRLTVCRSILSMLGDENQTPTLTDHFPDVKKMVPLTLEQLREMEKPTPVWAEMEEKTIEAWDGYWCICHRGHIITPGLVSMHADKMDGVTFYTYPPAHIDREAWNKPCLFCSEKSKGRKTLAFDSAGDAVTLEIDGNKAAIESDSMGFIVEFCPKCGRPLTEEAWSELENRLRGLGCGSLQA